MQAALTEAQISMPVAQAREKVAEYLRSVRERHNAEDEAILRGYRALAKGHTVIDLPKCIRLGGEFDTGLPRLAIATASHQFVWVRRGSNWDANSRQSVSTGSVSFWPGNERDIAHNRRKDIYRCPRGTLSVGVPVPSGPQGRQWDGPWGGNYRAMVPHVPPALRPKASLDNYAILFEVENWALDPSAPRDPALLKHIGGDLYAVLATWDLTPLEQSVLNGRTR